MNGEAVVVADGLAKRYGDLAAVDGISFQVGRGEIFGMVGPDGAGKTTTVECVEGLRRPDAGRVTVLGLDPWQDAAALRERMGVQLQTACLPGRIKVGEAVGLFASFYRQRLFVALALINRPEVVFLDELTTGLDPQGRRAAWDLVREIRTGGATVVLTTHFMDEAEHLCDRVAIVDRGRIVALDAPAALVRSLGDEARIVFEADGDLNAATLGVLDGVRRVARDGERVII